MLLSGAFFGVGLRDKITVGNQLHASLLHNTTNTTIVMLALKLLVILYNNQIMLVNALTFSRKYMMISLVLKIETVRESEIM